MDIVTELTRLFGLKSTSQVCQGGEVIGQGGYLSFRRSVTVVRNDSKQLHVFIKSSDVSRTDLDKLQQTSNYFCRTECVFYGLMAPVLERVLLQCEIEPPYPRVFGQRICDKGTILVMEDMTKDGFSLIDQSSFGIEHAYCVVKTLARLQAAYWIARTSFNNSLDSVLFGTESQFSESVRRSGIDFKFMVIRNAAYFTANLGKRVKSAEDAESLLGCLGQFMDRLLVDFAGLLPNARSRPAGLAHGDLWFPNFMFKGEGDALTCRLFDWQFWDIGLFGLDLGVLMVSSLSTEAMREHVDKIPAVYYKTFNEIYESRTGSQAPFTEEAALSCMGGSFLWALMWVVTSSDVLWETDYVDVPSMLANMAFAIRTGRVALPAA